MGSLSSILEQLDERYIARLIGIPHDETRMKYAPPLFGISGIDEFTRVITEKLKGVMPSGKEAVETTVSGQMKVILKEPQSRSLLHETQY